MMNKVNKINKYLIVYCIISYVYYVNSLYK